VGASPLEAGQRPLDRLTRIGVNVIHDAVTTIDPQTRSVEVGGQRMQADALVVALGAELAPEAVPGLRPHALNVYDAQEIPRAAQALSDFRGGRLLIGIFGAPYKCPPAPYEMALLINEFFRSRGLTVSLEVFTPQPMSLPVLGTAGCDVIESRLAENAIAFLPNHKATAVEAGEVVFANARRPYDLLLAVPPHRPPAAVRQSGLVDASGWVPVNTRTLETQFPGVYAIGDVVQIAMANGKPLPKAGVFAEAMGEVVADRIAATFAGQEPQATFQGEGGCYLEVGAGQAMMVQGRFLAAPEPEVLLTEASPQHLNEKRAFEAQRLQAWFA
jgi:sulfide:quinone oxidoreductase